MSIPIPTEAQEQQAVIRWARLAAIQDRRLHLLHGDASGVRVNIGVALKMKKAGAIKGFPDLFLPVKTAYFSGLFVELKRLKGGKVSPEQSELHDQLRSQGYAVFVCRGADEAIKCLKNYLGMA